MTWAGVADSKRAKRSQRCQQGQQYRFAWWGVSHRCGTTQQLSLTLAPVTGTDFCITQDAIAVGRDQLSPVPSGTLLMFLPFRVCVAQFHQMRSHVSGGLLTSACSIFTGCYRAEWHNSLASSAARMNAPRPTYELLFDLGTCSGYYGQHSPQLCEQLCWLQRTYWMIVNAACL
jgi:hypothetical protein